MEATPDPAPRLQFDTAIDPKHTGATATLGRGVGHRHCAGTDRRRPALDSRRGRVSEPASPQHEARRRVASAFRRKIQGNVFVAI